MHIQLERLADRVTRVCPRLHIVAHVQSAQLIRRVGIIRLAPDPRSHCEIHICGPDVNSRPWIRAKISRRIRGVDNNTAARFGERRVGREIVVGLGHRHRKLVPPEVNEPAYRPAIGTYNQLFVVKHKGRIRR